MNAISDVNLFGKLLVEGPRRRLRVRVGRSASAIGGLAFLVFRKASTMAQIENEVLYWINVLQPHEWVMLMAAVIIVGGLCMKGAANRPHF
jgi:hypothetical protein